MNWKSATLVAIEIAAAAALVACGGGSSDDALSQAQDADGKATALGAHRGLSGPSGKTTLTVKASAGGTITSAPVGISCSSSSTSGCSNTFYQGAIVTMHAAVTSGYQFTGWGGACTGTGDCVATVGTSAISVSANFSKTSTTTVGGTGTTTTTGTGTSTPSMSGYQIGYSSCPTPVTGGHTYTIGLLTSAGAASGPQTIAAFTGWNTLVAGDVVCIYGKSTPYAERVVLTRSGSAGAPVRVVGVVQNGYEPVLTGKSATTAAAFNYGTTISVNYESGEVSITGLTRGSPVAYVNVEGLTIQGATTAEVSGTAANPIYSVNAYSDPNINNNQATAWGCGSAGVNIIRADHISLIHNRIKDNDNGIFVNSNNGEPSSNVLIAYNHIYGNGVYGEAQGAWNPGQCDLDSHGVYTEAKTISYVGNRFGAPRQGEPTSLLKDRSAGLSISYNTFLPDGVLEAKLGDSALVGAVPQSFGHILDLVESYDPGVGFNTLGAVYQNVSVFGNFFFDDSAGTNAGQGTTAPLHFGGDQGVPSAYRTKLHFYNNTVVTRRDSASSDNTLGWFELETGTTADSWNNIFYASANKTQSAGAFTLLNSWCYNKPCGAVNYAAQNWISPVYGTTGVNGTATDPSFLSLSTNDVHIASNNATIVGNGQTGNSAYPATSATVALQYVDFLGSTARPFSAAKIDLGAFGYQP